MKEKIDNFSNRLKKAMELKNIKAVSLSEKSGVDKSKISSYLSGRYKANQDTLFILANALDVSPSWLMGFDVPMSANIDTSQKKEANQESKDLAERKFENTLNFKYYMCPVYGQISAGIPNWAEECIEGRIPIDPVLFDIVNPEEHFFLKVNGESMNKLIKNGAYALIHKQDIVDEGEIAVILVNGDEATLKRFNRQGKYILLEPMSNDISFKTQIYDKNTPIKILGKYVGKFEINE